MKIKIISTFSDKGYNDYGKYFVDSCKKFINKNIDVQLYIDHAPLSSQENVTILKLEETVPKLTEFKFRNKSRTFKDFRWDGIRFAHKVYATTHAANEKLDYLIWLDSDTEIYNKITPKYLISFLPKGKFVGYLGRDGTSETGFLIFDMNHPCAKEFFERYQWYYDSDSIYNLRQCHDAWVFDTVRKEFEATGKIESYNITPAGVVKGHFNSTFKNYMVHYKGDSKKLRDEHLAKMLKRSDK